ncbi:MULTISPECIES: hypothetical protein [Halorussus]|uniref:hypothetical protein n=1 Tax=Halorussus TaxID=1070314 RepID=UPI00209D9F9E|nr:hypothetical protein [Halorussus vallis]
MTGPHRGSDRAGEYDHCYWRCERCGLETTDPRIREGCFRCEARKVSEGNRAGLEEASGEAARCEARGKATNSEASDEGDDARRA